MMYYAVMALIMVLWVIRGNRYRGAMVVAIPAILGAAMGLKWGIWIGCLTFLTSNAIRIGYGNYEIGEKNSWLAEMSQVVRIFKDKEGAIIRGIWGFIVSLAICLPLVILGHRFQLAIWYIPLNTIISYSVSKFKIPGLITDIMVGLSLSSILI